ncbi:hypothetical protein GCM10010431_58820 [Streptomyces kunmingensis]
MFRFRSAESHTADLIVVRADVPTAQVQSAEQFIALLRREHGVSDRLTDEDEATELERVPAGAAGWVLAPTGPASEELFSAVMHRIENESENDAG